MKMNKMELAPAIANSQEVSRFGITLRTTLSVNDVVDMDKFFYYYYKVTVCLVSNVTIGRTSK